MYCKGFTLDLVLKPLIGKNEVLFVVHEFQNFHSLQTCIKSADQKNRSSPKLENHFDCIFSFILPSYLLKSTIICFDLQFNKNNWVHCKSLSGFWCISTLKTFFKCAFNCVTRYFFDQLIWYKFADCQSSEIREPQIKLCSYLLII